jgi:DNA-3-methyladenine glycosylase I
MKKRCAWCGEDPLYMSYHDNEWGVPVHEDRLLFEFLVLEGAQAGLSWLTILRKRDNYRKAFDNFNIARVAQYTEKDINRLLLDPGIVRNRLKIEAAIKNAKGILAIQKEYGSFDAYLWKCVGGRPIQNRPTSMADLSATSPISDQLSKDLKKRGFNFVGSTICYSLMQAVGLVNDHFVDCFRYKEVDITTAPRKGRAHD